MAEQGRPSSLKSIRRTKLAAPFNETVRELGEMKGLWQAPIRLDNTRLVAFLGKEPHTPLDEAVAVTLRKLGSIRAA